MRGNGEGVRELPTSWIASHILLRKRMSIDESSVMGRVKCNDSGVGESE